MYDADGNGMFDMQELRNLLTTYGNKEVPEHELHVLSKYLDRNGNGYITWDEFVDGIRGATGARAARRAPPRPSPDARLSSRAPPPAPPCPPSAQSKRTAHSSCR